MTSFLTSPGAIANIVIAITALTILLGRLYREMRMTDRNAGEDKRFYVNFMLAAIVVMAMVSVVEFMADA